MVQTQVLDLFVAFILSEEKNFVYKEVFCPFFLPESLIPGFDKDSGADLGRDDSSSDSDRDQDNGDDDKSDSDADSKEDRDEGAEGSQRMSVDEERSREERDRGDRQSGELEVSPLDLPFFISF